MHFRIIGEVRDIETIASQKPRYIGMRHSGLAKRNSKLSGSSGEAAKRRVKAEPQFAVCVDNRGYSTSLELRKIYRVLPDSESASRQLVRIIDESGEDYLYPQKYFVSIELSQTLERALLRAS
jgi:hypothetical protein